MAMTEAEAKTMISRMLANLEGQEMQGIDLPNLAEVMKHPKAVESVAEMLPLEATSVQAGQAAPDFSLPYLPGSRPRTEPEDARVTLSEHLGRRPVALIFGSYT